MVLWFLRSLTNQRVYPDPGDPRNGAVRHTGAAMESANAHQRTRLIRKGKSVNIVTIGTDLAKGVFAVQGVDETGKPALV